METTQFIIATENNEKLTANTPEAMAPADNESSETQYVKIVFTDNTYCIAKIPDEVHNASHMEDETVKWVIKSFAHTKRIENCSAPENMFTISAHSFISGELTVYHPDFKPYARVDSLIDNVLHANAIMSAVELWLRIHVQGITSWEGDAPW